MRNRDPAFLVGAYTDSVEACCATLRIPSVEWLDAGSRGESGLAESLALAPGQREMERTANGRTAYGHNAAIGDGKWTRTRNDESGRHRNDWTFPAQSPQSQEPPDLTAGACGWCTFDPPFWPLDALTAGHPPAYMWGLARAWGAAGHGGFARLPAEFVLYLQVPKAGR